MSNHTHTPDFESSLPERTSAYYVCFWCRELIPYDKQKWINWVEQRERRRMRNIDDFYIECAAPYNTRDYDE